MKYQIFVNLDFLQNIIPVIGKETNILVWVLALIHLMVNQEAGTYQIIRNTYRPLTKKFY